MKFTFKHVVEWSDWSEHSPSHTGQLPCAVILPDGERVEMDNAEIFFAERDLLLLEAQLGGSNAIYAQLHPSVRFRESTWGDSGNRRQGRGGSKLEVMAPKGSRFMFARYCPGCGGEAGEQELPGERYSERADPLWHVECQARAQAEQE